MSMATSAAPPTKLPAWQALEAYYPKARELHLRKLFADDAKRGERMTAEAVGSDFDHSKDRVTDETIRLLLQLAEQSGLRALGRTAACHLGRGPNLSRGRAASAQESLAVTIDDLAREGARRMIAAALKVEVNDGLSRYSDERDQWGHALVVRN